MAVHRPRVCHRCKRPLRETQGYKKIEGRFTNYYCDEHIVLTATGWRLLEPGEVPPPAVGSQEAAAATAAEAAPMTSVADLAAESIEQGIPYDADVTGGPHYHAIERTPATAAAPIVEHLKELRQQPPADFNPLDDVGF